MRAAIERDAEAQGALLAGDRDGALAAFHSAADLYRASWETSPPRSYGRLLGHGLFGRRRGRRRGGLRLALCVQVSAGRSGSAGSERRERPPRAVHVHPQRRVERRLARPDLGKR